jgi:resuscitation-promoting factor RpfB
MKLRVRKSTTIITVTASSLLLGLVLSLLAFFPRTAEAQVEGGRLISVHDRGSETTFVTTEETLQAALAQQGISLDPKDAVEPSLDEKLVAPDYQVNIYRARPVTIVDGALRQKVISPYQSAEKIVKDAGITLYPEDRTTLSRSADFVTDGAGLELSIKRATPLTVDLYGKTTELRTQAVTVEGLLKEKGITLGEDGRVSASLSTSITSGMSLRIWREGKQTITVDEEVAFGVEQIKDADRTVGYKAIQTPGQNGKRTVTYEVEIQNGAEVARTEIASIILQEPIAQVEVVGSKPATLPYTGGGTKTDWLIASGVAEADWGYADYLVTRESGWNPNAVNASSGACGLAQALPCSKVPGNPYNPIDSLNWMNGYVNGRYGGWQNAYNFWITHHWY